LNRTIWGVEFFLLCDRDAAYAIGEKSIAAHLSDRLKILPRYHLENFFLDESVLANLFGEMETDPESWLRSKERIGDVLRELAREVIPYATALRVSAAIREIVGNVDIMPSNIGATLAELVGAFGSRLIAERNRIATSLDSANVEQMCRAEFAALQAAVADGNTWKRDIPGRIVFNRFAGKARLQAGRLKTLYLRHAQSASTDPFVEIREIFQQFRDAAPLPPLSLSPQTGAA
jgi:hypothetical protein